VTSSHDAKPVAAIDCGTNSTRLLVVDPCGETLERHMRITRLGEDVDSTRRLSEAAISRTVDVLAEYRRIMDDCGVAAARMVATSATRDASNAGEFFSSAQSVTGIRPELLSGEEEGRLSFAGATAHLPANRRSEGALLVVDIGGGSTELVVGDPGVTDGLDRHQPVACGDVTSLSLDIGCVRISERFLGGDPPTDLELGGARAFVEATLFDARRRLPNLEPDGIVIGLAGTVSTIAALEARLTHYDRAAVHHAVLTRRQVGKWLETLGGENTDARLKRPGMVVGREDVIVGGVLILDAVMEVFGRTQCLVSEEDILDGLAASVRIEMT